MSFDLIQMNRPIGKIIADALATLSLDLVALIAAYAQYPIARADSVAYRIGSWTCGKVCFVACSPNGDIWAAMKVSGYSDNETAVCIFDSDGQLLRPVGGARTFLLFISSICFDNDNAFIIRLSLGHIAQFNLQGKLHISFGLAIRLVILIFLEQLGACALCLPR